MLKSFKVNNYKNFENDLEIDFSKVNGYQFSKDCITHNMIGKMIIYGKNATGKTNFGDAICDLRDTLNPMSMIIPHKSIIKNANSKNDISSFTYTFLFNDKKDVVIYEYSKYSREFLKNEKLILNNQILYDFSFDNMEFNDYDASIFDNDIVIQNFLNNTKNEVDKSLPFLSWLAVNASIQENSVIIKIYEFSKKIVNISNPGYHYRLLNSSYINTLEKNLDHLQDFLNDMGVQCHLTIERLPDGKKELYFAYDHQKVPFLSNASSGTLTLFHFYIRFIMPHRSCSILYFDEFDAFFHFELAEKVVFYLKKEFKNSLIILTTHNTNLMTNRFMRPDCLFLLSSQLTPLCNATERELREGHNLEKLYINGEFDEE